MTCATQNPATNTAAAANCAVFAGAVSGAVGSGVGTSEKWSLTVGECKVQYIPKLYSDIAATAGENLLNAPKVNVRVHWCSASTPTATTTKVVGLGNVFYSLYSGTTNCDTKIITTAAGGTSATDVALSGNACVSAATTTTTAATTSYKITSITTTIPTTFGAQVMGATAAVPLITTDTLTTI